MGRSAQRLGSSCVRLCIIQDLAVRAEKASPFLYARVFLERWNVASRALHLRVNEPVFPQLKDLFPLVEIEAVGPGLRDEFGEFPGWQGADHALGMHADAEEYLVFDNVADSREDILLEQRVADIQVGKFPELSTGFRRIPFVIHHVRGPIVNIIKVSAELC